MLWMWLMEKLDFDLPVFIPVHHHLAPPTFLSKKENCDECGDQKLAAMRRWGWPCL